MEVGPRRPLPLGPMTTPWIGEVTQQGREERWLTRTPSLSGIFCTWVYLAIGEFLKNKEDLCKKCKVRKILVNWSQILYSKESKLEFSFFLIKEKKLYMDKSSLTFSLIYLS